MSSGEDVYRYLNENEQIELDRIISEISSDDTRESNSGPITLFTIRTHQYWSHYFGIDGLDEIFYLNVVPVIKSKYSNFNIKFFNLSKYHYSKSEGGTMLENIIKDFFFGNLNLTKKYYIILKIKTSNHKWVNIHKSIMVTPECVYEYIDFVNWQIRIKENVYLGDESKFRTIAFEYLFYDEYMNYGS